MCVIQTMYNRYIYQVCRDLTAAYLSPLFSFSLLFIYLFIFCNFIVISKNLFKLVILVEVVQYNLVALMQFAMESLPLPIQLTGLVFLGLLTYQFYRLSFTWMNYSETYQENCLRCLSRQTWDWWKFGGFHRTQIRIQSLIKIRTVPYIKLNKSLEILHGTNSISEITVQIVKT